MPTLLDLLGRVSPILNTVPASALEKEFSVVRSEYENHTLRYFPSKAVKELGTTLVKKISNAESPLGYLLGEYGYGKTAAAIYLWSHCEDSGVLAVPPFQFTAFDSLCAGTYHAVRVRLAEQDTTGNACQTADTLYERYRSRSQAERAETIARSYNITLEAARNIVAEHIAPNLSVGEPAFAADFLADLSDTVRKAGFRGLVLFADETQNFLQSGDMETNIADLRRLIFALRGRHKSLGVLFVLHEKMAMRLADVAGDALQRLAADGVSLNLTKQISTQFPQDLFDFLCAQAGEKEDKYVEKGTLEALGQIAARGDLSNGPRTVACALNRIALFQNDNERPYTVLDLMDDYRERRIVFEGRHISISGEMNQLLSKPVIQNNTGYGRLVRFLSGFPDGASADLIKAYGLTEALRALCENGGFLGTEIFTPRKECYALTRLQAEPTGEETLHQVLRAFRDNWWNHEKPATLHATARAALVRFILPEIFPRKGSGDVGRKFSGHKIASSALTGLDPERVELVGTFENCASRFPERRVSVAVGVDEARLAGWDAWANAPHVAFAIRLHNNSADEIAPHQIVTGKSDPRIDITFNSAVTVGAEFPHDLRLLQTILLPSSCSAEALLNLLYFLDDYVNSTAGANLSDQDRADIETHLIRNARRVIEQMLLTSETESVGIAVRGLGKARFENLFVDKITERYPNYAALYPAPEVRTLLERYKKLLRDGGLKLTVKRGGEPFETTSGEFAECMGATGSAYDAVVDRLKRLKLLQAKEVPSPEPRIRRYEFTLCEHPLEKLLREAVEKHGEVVSLQRGGREAQTKRMALTMLNSMARKAGYTDEEINQALSLSARRQYLEADASFVQIAVIDADPDVLRREANRLLAEITEFTHIAPSEAAPLLEAAGQALHRIEAANGEPDALVDIGPELREITTRLGERIRAEGRRKSEQMASTEQKLRGILRTRLLAPLQTPLALSTTVGARVDEARRKRLRDADKLTADAEGLLDTLHAASQLTAQTVGEMAKLHAEGARLGDKVRDIALRVETETQEARRVSGWSDLAHRAHALDTQLSDGARADLTQRFQEWNDVVFQAFTGDFAAALQSIEQFRTPFDGIERDLADHQAGEAARFHAFVQKLGDEFGRAKVERPRPVPFDHQKPSASYSHLAQEASDLLQRYGTALFSAFAVHASRCRFLQAFRESSVADLIASCEREQKALDDVFGDISEAAILSYQREQGRLPAILGIYERAGRERDRVAQRVRDLDVPRPPSNAREEKLVLHLRGKSEGAAEIAGSPVLLSQLFGAFVGSADEEVEEGANQLFDTLSGLYRKGLVEIQVRLTR